MKLKRMELTVKKDKKTNKGHCWVVPADTYGADA